MGGHFVPEETIRRCYHRGLKNFFNLYIPLADQWSFYDNSDSSKFILIAAKNHVDKIHIEQPSLWHTLQEKYHEK
jgi:predicted ABC-type ATPase